MLPFQNPLVLRGVEDMWGGNRAFGCWLNRNVLTKKDLDLGVMNESWLWCISYWKKKGGISNIFLEGRLLTTGNSCSILCILGGGRISIAMGST